MKHKLLPLPVGEQAPQGSAVRFWQQYSFRVRADGATLALGLLLGAAGAWLGLHPAPVRVGVDAAGYHLGVTVLTPGAAGSYSGDTAVVIKRRESQVRAAAAGALGRRRMQGICIYVAGSDSEQCIFVVGNTTFHARDQLVGGAWLRRYDNGRTTELKLADPTHPTPVPIPVGWQ
ncbi:MAG: hypothetical protein ACR2MY_15120 [Candidatus Dormibacteria bacterium]